MHRVVGNDGPFRRLCELIGAPELSSDPRFVTNAHRDALKQLLEPKLMQFDCEPLADPHTQHRGMSMENGDEYRGVASPIKLSRTPATYRAEPPPKEPSPRNP